MNMLDKIEKVKESVSEYFDKNAHSILSHMPSAMIDENRNHIINIATSIYCVKNKVTTHGGSFVYAVAEDKLMEAFSRADDINVIAMKFYVVMLNSMRMVTFD